MNGSYITQQSMPLMVRNNNKNIIIMKKYVKPITECVEGTVSMPLMLSLYDEVGDGQLVNSFDFEEEEEYEEKHHPWNGKLDNGF